MDKSETEPAKIIRVPAKQRKNYRALAAALAETFRIDPPGDLLAILCAAEERPPRLRTVIFEYPKRRR